MNKIESRIKETKEGFNYIEVTPEENLNWGGICICNGCGKQFLNENMKLVFVLADTYCKKCFKEWCYRKKNLTKEDIEHDLKIQNEMSLKWYKLHLDIDPSSNSKIIKICDLPKGMVIWRKKTILGITGVTLPEKYYEDYCTKIIDNDFDYELINR